MSFKDALLTAALPAIAFAFILGYSLALVGS